MGSARSVLNVTYGAAINWTGFGNLKCIDVLDDRVFPPCFNHKVLENAKTP